MDYIREYEKIQKIFKFLGFENSLHKVAIMRMNFILLVSHLIALMMFRKKVIYTRDSLSETCDILKVAISFLSWACEIFLMTKCKQIRKIIENKQEELEVYMEMFYVNELKAKQKFCTKVVWQVYIISGIYISRLITEGIVLKDENQTLCYVIFTLYMLSYCVIKHTHLIFYMEMLNYYFELLLEQTEYLNELFQCNEKLMNARYEKFLIKKLQKCQSYYQILRQLKHLINSWCAPFLFVYHMKIFVFITASLYWMNYRLTNQTDLSRNIIIAISIFDIGCHLLQLLSMANSSEKLIDQKTMLALHIHNIDVAADRLNDQFGLMDLIENFSSDLMEDNMEISANGYFRIGYGWIAEVSQVCNFAYGMLTIPIRLDCVKSHLVNVHLHSALTQIQRKNYIL